MKDAFVPSSVLRLRRRLSEDKMINIDIADVLFAGMVFPVMKFVKKIVLPRVRKAWEKVKEVAKKMACTEAPPVSDLESQSESNGSTDDLGHAPYSALAKKPDPPSAPQGSPLALENWGCAGGGIPF